MGIFVNYLNKKYAGLKHIPQNIISTTAHSLWVTGLDICNRTAAPLRFNLQKTEISGFSSKTCFAATTTNLNFTIYNNGTAGVGATITNNAPTLTPFSVDGVIPVINSRILVKDQTSAFQNGIYTLTTPGTSSIPWVLTRATDYNKPTLIHNGDLILLTNGNLNANTRWVQTSTVTTIGTSNITFIVNIPVSIYKINEFEIKPYDSVDIINKIGIVNMVYSSSPFISESLICFSNGYTQVFDCEVTYAELNELP